MKKGQDITVNLPGIILIHQKVPGRELERHTHKEHEFFIPLQGEITVSYDNKSLHCGVGKMLYIPAGLEHCFSSTASGEGERIICLLEEKLWKSAADKSVNPTVMPLNSLIRELVFYLLLNSGSKFSKTFIKALCECLVENLKMHENLRFDDIDLLKSKIKDVRVKKAFDLIINNDITVSELAKKSGLSSRNLNKLFMLEVGVTPKNLMVLKKINHAKILLRTTSMTITDISFEVGYNSLSKFISMFQKITGTLPSDYRVKS